MKPHYGNIGPLLEKLIPKPGMITVLTTVGQKVDGFDLKDFVLIPNPSDKAAIDFCHSLKPTGWDWQPENLERLQLRYNQMFIFVARPTHSLKQTEELISKRFHIHEIGFSDSALGCLFKTPYGGDEVSVQVQQSKTRKHPVKEYPSEEELEQSDPEFKRNSHVDPRSAYVRTRSLWKNHNKDFSDWETKFVKDIGVKLSKNYNLTENQKKALGRLFGKYKVSQTDIASAE